MERYVYNTKLVIGCNKDGVYRSNLYLEFANPPCFFGLFSIRLFFDEDSAMPAQKSVSRAERSNRSSSPRGGEALPSRKVIPFSNSSLNLAQRHPSRTRLFSVARRIQAKPGFWPEIRAVKRGRTGNLGTGSKSRSCCLRWR